MKKLLFIIIVVTFCGSLTVEGQERDSSKLRMQITKRFAKEIAQVKKSKVKVTEQTRGWMWGEDQQMPTFNGGCSALQKYLEDNKVYPEEAKKNKIEGRVVVSFIIEKDGSVSDVSIVKSVDPSLDEEAIRLISNMPRWIPGREFGRLERVKYNVPVSFRLNNNNQKSK